MQKRHHIGLEIVFQNGRINLHEIAPDAADGVVDRNFGRPEFGVLIRAKVAENSAPSATSQTNVRVPGICFSKLRSRSSFRATMATS